MSLHAPSGKETLFSSFFFFNKINHFKLPETFIFILDWAMNTESYRALWSKMKEYKTSHLEITWLKCFNHKGYRHLIWCVYLLHCHRPCQTHPIIKLRTWNATTKKLWPKLINTSTDTNSVDYQAFCSLVEVFFHTMQEWVATNGSFFWRKMSPDISSHADCEQTPEGMQ